MPVYEYECGYCGKHKDQFAKVEERDFNKPKCCGHEMYRVVTAASVMPDIQPHRNMLTGEIVESRSRHRQILKEHGLVEIGDQHHAHQRQIEQRKKEQEKKEAQALRQEIAARIDSIT